MRMSVTPAHFICTKSEKTILQYICAHTKESWVVKGALCKKNKAGGAVLSRMCTCECVQQEALCYRGPVPVKCVQLLLGTHQSTARETLLQEERHMFWRGCTEKGTAILSCLFVHIKRNEVSVLKSHLESWVWLCKPVIITVEWLSQEDHELELSLGKTVGLSPIKARDVCNPIINPVLVTVAKEQYHFYLLVNE